MRAEERRAWRRRARRVDGDAEGFGEREGWERTGCVLWVVRRRLRRVVVVVVVVGGEGEGEGEEVALALAWESADLVFEED